MPDWSQTEIEEAMEKVRKDPFQIKWMKRPPRPVQVVAVMTNPASIQYIRHTDVDIQFIAVEHDAHNCLNWIRHPHPETLLKACAAYGRNLLKIKNPTYAMQLAAVTQDGSLIEKVKEQTEEMQLAALKSSNWCFIYFKNPSKRVRMAAIHRFAPNIQFIKNPSVEEQIRAVTDDPNSFRFIKSLD
jgi:hypothetical protein